jgi:hypothetical protein
VSLHQFTSGHFDQTGGTKRSGLFNFFLLSNFFLSQTTQIKSGRRCTERARQSKFFNKPYKKASTVEDFFASKLRHKLRSQRVLHRASFRTPCTSVRWRARPMNFRFRLNDELAGHRVTRCRNEARRAHVKPFFTASRRHGGAGTTCTETFSWLKASAGPSQEPESGEAFSCSRATATEICSLPTSLLFVGSKPRHPAPGR